MLNSYCARFAGLALVFAATLSCGSDSGPGAPPLGGASTPAGGTPAAVDNGAAGSASTPGNAGTPTSTGEVTPGETTNAGLDGAPVTGANAGEPTNGATGAAASASSDGGAIVTPPATGSPFPSSVTRPKIMIVGDSISAGQGCYKKFLLADLNNNGYTNFDFVGEYTDDCGGGVMHSARSCSTATQYTQAEFTLSPDCNPTGTFPGLAPLEAKFNPDLLMLQLGVNDVWNGRSTDAILADYATLVQQARAQNANVVIAIAQIQKIHPASDGDAILARAELLVNALPAWAQAQSQPQSPVFVADLWTNSDSSSTETLDGVHPNDLGAEHMGQNWFNTLKNILPQD